MRIGVSVTVWSRTNPPYCIAQGTEGVTHPLDLVVAEALVEGREEPEVAMEEQKGAYGTAHLQ